MKKMFAIEYKKIKLTTVFRWDLFYVLSTYLFGFLGLVYAGLSIKHFSEIPNVNPCLFRTTHIHKLYIACMFLLVVFYSFNTLSASFLTAFVTNIMRYLVPPTLLGLSSYLVYLTNYFVNMAAKLVIN
jgi:drug/metabolite transporter (DMT)-like permease